jgi:hypothetical protein
LVAYGWETALKFCQIYTKKSVKIFQNQFLSY